MLSLKHSMLNILKSCLFFLFLSGYFFFSFILESGSRTPFQTIFAMCIVDDACINGAIFFSPWRQSHFLLSTLCVFMFCLSVEEDYKKLSSIELQTNQSQNDKCAALWSRLPPPFPSCVSLYICVVCIQGVSTSGVWAMFSFEPIPMLCEFFSLPSFSRLPSSSLSHGFL